MPTSIEQSFSWAQWTPNTSLTLCNVPWDSSYRDVVRFADDAARQRYFASLDSVDVEHATMHKFGQPVLLEIPFNEASGWNYLVAYNDYPTLEAPRRWYYFIQNVEYVNAHTTRMVIMLDVWQSFLYDWSVGNSYIIKGHIGVANERQMRFYGRDYLTYPEGLDTGSSMHTRSQEFKSLLSKMPVPDGADFPGNSIVYDFGVLVASTTQLDADAGTVDAPSLKAAGGSLFDNGYSGVNYYWFPQYIYAAAALSLLSTYSWVGQGIVSIRMTPRFLDAYFRESGTKLNKIAGRETLTEYYALGSLSPNRTSLRNPLFMSVKDFRDKFNIPERYRNLKKLQTYPYTAIEMTCNNGQSLVLQPELITSDNLDIRCAYSFGGSGSRLQFYVPRYNGVAGEVRPFTAYDGTPVGVPLDSGEQFGASVGVQDLPSFATVNNGSALAMANSAYTRQFAEQSAQWTQSKAYAATNTARENVMYSNLSATEGTRRGNAARSALTAISTNQAAYANMVSRETATEQASVADARGIFGVGQSAASGMLSGGPAGAAIGAVMGGASLGADMWARNESLRISNDASQKVSNAGIAAANASTEQQNALASSMTGLSNATANDIADNNATLANYVASGDYANTIAGINAQVQQMKLIPPTVAGQAGGDTFNLSNGIMGLQLKFKTCEPSALAAAGEYFLRYGYFVQRFLTPPKDLKCMTNFTYWKMAEAYIAASHMPEQYRMTIKGILEAGTTVWTRPGDIGTIDYANNEPINGISY